MSGWLYDMEVKGESGNSYTFHVYSKDTQFRHIGAIYIFVRLTSKDGNISTKALYIGETEDLYNRIEEHEKWECVLKHGCTHICTMREEDRKKRLAIETDLRHKYDTYCNNQ